MAKKGKGNRVQVILECTEQKASGVPGMSRYITTKNKKNTPDRMERKKYNPPRMPEFKAEKLKRPNRPPLCTNIMVLHMFFG